MLTNHTFPFFFLTPMHVNIMFRSEMLARKRTRLLPCVHPLTSAGRTGTGYSSLLRTNILRRMWVWWVKPSFLLTFSLFFRSDPSVIRYPTTWVTKPEMLTDEWLLHESGYYCRTSMVRLWLGVWINPAWNWLVGCHMGMTNFFAIWFLSVPSVISFRRPGFDRKSIHSFIRSFTHMIRAPAV